MNNEQFKQLWTNNKESHEMEAERSVLTCEKALMDIVRLKQMAQYRLNKPDFDKFSAIGMIIEKTHQHQEEALFRLEDQA